MAIYRKSRTNTRIKAAAKKTYSLDRRWTAGW